MDIFSLSSLHDLCENKKKWTSGGWPPTEGFDSLCNIEIRDFCDINVDIFF